MEKDLTLKINLRWSGIYRRTKNGSGNYAQERTVLHDHPVHRMIRRVKLHTRVLHNCSLSVFCSLLAKHFTEFICIFFRFCMLKNPNLSPIHVHDLCAYIYLVFFPVRFCCSFCNCRTWKSPFWMQPKSFWGIATVKQWTKFTELPSNSFYQI